MVSGIIWQWARIWPKRRGSVGGRTRLVYTKSDFCSTSKTSQQRDILDWRIFKNNFQFYWIHNEYSRRKAKEGISNERKKLMLNSWWCLQTQEFAAVKLFARKWWHKSAVTSKLKIWAVGNEDTPGLGGGCGTRAGRPPAGASATGRRSCLWRKENDSRIREGEKALETEKHSPGGEMSRSGN